ncbi:ANKMY2 isoform 6 [Pongo abelii]|uniref:ANKMY2 isoform 5 n=1 Tax=Pongo abelii TaxID=9601 RepID=A0A2J8VEF3_PONAB|nr:ANKMY2 isoform 5 [Pongo abelii]PNJ55905.1 ANKMY2 isoform 6 [Pongo abelii]
MVHIKKGELTQEEKELLEVIGKGVPHFRSAESPRGAPRTSQKPYFPGVPEWTSQRSSLPSPVTWQVTSA